MKISTLNFLLIWIVLTFCGHPFREVCIVADESIVQIRKPVAIAIVDEGRRIITANHRSGTISLLNLADQKQIREVPVGKQLSDIVTTIDPQRLLVTDEAAHQLISLKLSPTECKVEKRLAVSPYPVSVRVSADGTRAFVASLWSRTVSVVDLAAWLAEGEQSAASPIRQIRLPFAPREMVVVEVDDQRRMGIPPDQPSIKLIVADAFGSKLACIDPDSAEVLSVREIAGHAIRRMQLHPVKPQIVLTHQLLNRLGQTTFDDIHWGSLMLNGLRTLELSEVLDRKRDLLSSTVVEYIGGPDRGAGDPAGFVIKPNGFIGIALSGTDEFIIDQGQNLLFTTRLKTGNCPTAVATSPDYSTAFIVNSLSDSVTVMDLRRQKIAETISLGSRPEMTAEDRGERLFHSARLSHDSWISCASCHVNGHTNGLLNDNFTDGTFGTAKRVLSLRGVADTAPYAWSGRFPTLAGQIEHSIQSTMQGKVLTESQTDDLEAYLKTLPPVPPVGSEDKIAIRRGGELFERLDCRRCHAPPTFTSPQVADVDLKDEEGRTKFNPPSLRGVSQNGPYFHDGRAASLKDVFKQFRHQLDRDLSDEELHDLVEFLKSL
jgi:DNA-binding beta-propeller fold protein YncE